MFVNYAHRGASEYAPENTFSAFYLGLLQGANGIETDVRLTKDNIPVLFHDDMVNRVTDGTGYASDYTLENLLELNVFKDSCAITDKITTFENFLNHFAHRNITFAIEIKQTGAEEQVVKLLEKYNMVEKTIVTSFEYEHLNSTYKINKEIRLGYLVSEVTDSVIEQLKQINGYQICPNAKILTPEHVSRLRKEGLSIRAWNVSDEDVMKRVYSYKIDGMTVNFPDKLAALSMALHEQT